MVISLSVFIGLLPRLVDQVPGAALMRDRSRSGRGEALVLVLSVVWMQVVLSVCILLSVSNEIVKTGQAGKRTHGLKF